MRSIIIASSSGRPKAEGATEHVDGITSRRRAATAGSTPESALHGPAARTSDADVLLPVPGELASLNEPSREEDVPHAAADPMDDDYEGDKPRPNAEAFRGWKSFLATLNFIWMHGVITLQLAHCAGGGNLRCFQGSLLKGLWPDVAFLNFFPKLIGFSGMHGLAVTAGMQLSLSQEGAQLHHVAPLIVLALLIQFGISNEFDVLMAGAGEYLSTSTHLWALWSLALAVLLIYLFDGGSTRPHQPSGRASSAFLSLTRPQKYLLALAAAIHVLSPLACAQLWPPKPVHRLPGLWFGLPWLEHQPEWQPLGVRVTSLVLPCIAAYCLAPRIMAALESIQSHLRRRALCFLAYAAIAYFAAFYVAVLDPHKLTLDLRDAAYARRVVRVADLAQYARPNWWLMPLRLQAHLVGTLASCAAPLLLAAALSSPPMWSDNLAGYLGESPLMAFAFFPHLVRLSEPYLMLLLYQYSWSAGLCAGIILLAPLLYQCLLVVPLRLVQPWLTHGDALAVLVMLAGTLRLLAVVT
eukprot:jgi/Mesvir1/1226/Mv17711-RA.1